MKYGSNFKLKQRLKEIKQTKEHSPIKIVKKIKPKAHLKISSTSSVTRSPLERSMTLPKKRKFDKEYT